MEVITVNREILEAAKDIKDLYSVDASGGYAHVVVDDLNVEDEHIDWCIDYTNQQPEGVVKAASIKCLNSLKALPEEHRRFALGVYDGWLTFFETKLQ